MHTPVLLNEILNIVQPKIGMTVIDATYGCGGHAKAISKLIGPEGKLIGIDRDPDILKQVTEIGDNTSLVYGNFANLSNIASELRIGDADVVIADFGFCSAQLDNPERGISFQIDGALDMRFDRSAGENAASLVNRLQPDQLEDIFKKYGELSQGLAKKLAKLIVEKRLANPITTTRQLADISKELFSKYPLKRREQKYLAQTFQALRIAVNAELDAIEKFLPQAVSLLKPGGKLAVISFHSLEDGRVKRLFKQESKGCLCPPDYPVCCCNHKAQLKLLTKQAVKPSDAEIAKNPRARSARLRVAEKL